MLFDDGVTPEFVRALKSLESAKRDLAVPYPYEEAADLALLKRIKTKYSLVDVGDLVDGFLVWCCDARPWVQANGKPATIRWRSRLWTRANNEMRYRNMPKRRFGGTHHAAVTHTEDTTVLKEW